MIEFHITTNALHADALSNELSLLGAATVTWQDAGDQPIYEPKPDQLIVWDEIWLSAFFEEDALQVSVYDYLIRQQKLCRLRQVEVKKVQEDWVLRSQEQCVPSRFGKRLWISPSGCALPEDPLAVNVLFNAGLAFGTGSHPTTALCLEWLDENNLDGATIMDYGCGSGILAVAALKLGAADAVAVDHDPQALEACRMNADLNQLACTRLAVFLPENLVSKKVDILIANILAQPLIELAPRFAKWVKPDGRLVLSGIMDTQYEEVAAAYHSWFSIGAPIMKEGWIRLDGCRQS